MVVNTVGGGSGISIFEALFLTAMQNWFPLVPFLFFSNAQNKLLRKIFFMYQNEHYILSDPFEEFFNL